MKVVINTSYGGFSLSKPAIKLYCQYLEESDPSSTLLKSITSYGLRVSDRTDPILVRVVEEMGGGADGSDSQLKVVEVPDDVKWTIQDYDGIEWVAEVHRTWD